MCPEGCPNKTSTCSGVHRFNSRGECQEVINIRREQVHTRRVVKQPKIKLEVPEPSTTPEDLFFDLTVDEEGTGTEGKTPAQPYLLEDLISQEELANFNSKHLPNEFGSGLSGVLSPDQLTLSKLDNRFQSRLFDGPQTKSYSSKDKQVEDVLNELKSKLNIPVPNKGICETVNASKGRTPVSTFSPLSPLKALEKFYKEGKAKIAQDNESVKTGKINWQSKEDKVRKSKGQYKYLDNREELSRKSSSEKAWDMEILNQRLKDQQAITETKYPAIEGYLKRPHPSSERDEAIKRSKLTHHNKMIVKAEHDSRTSYFEKSKVKVTRGGAKALTYGLPVIPRRQVPRLTSTGWEANHSNQKVISLPQIDHKKAVANLVQGVHTVAPDDTKKRKNRKGHRQNYLQGKWSRDTEMPTGHSKPQVTSTAPHKVGPLRPRPRGGDKCTYTNVMPSLPGANFHVSVAYVWNKCLTSAYCQSQSFAFDPYDPKLEGEPFATEFKKVYWEVIDNKAKSVIKGKKFPGATNHNFKRMVQNYVWMALYEMMLAKWDKRGPLPLKDETKGLKTIHESMIE